MVNLQNKIWHQTLTTPTELKKYMFSVHSEWGMGAETETHMVRCNNYLFNVKTAKRTLKPLFNNYFWMDWENVNFVVLIEIEHCKAYLPKMLNCL